MAKAVIRNGQTVTGGGTTIETEIIPNDKRATKIYFQVTTGTLQVTTDLEGQTNVVAADTFAFGTTHGINRMSVELDLNNQGGTRRVIYIQGTGTAYFTW